MTFKAQPVKMVVFAMFCILSVSAVTSISAAEDTLPESKKPLHWTTVARHVGQTEKSRDAALNELRKIPQLDKLLLKALRNHQRPLALDVISALKMDHLLPDLLKQVSNDQDGFLVLAINSLLNEKNKDLIFSTYLESLNTESAQAMPAAAIVAMLEPLGRVGHEIPLEHLKPLLKHEFPEVRSATLYYARLMSLSKKAEKYLPVIIEATHLAPFQLRLQAYSVVEELHLLKLKKSPRQEKAIKSNCEKEKYSYVKSRCQDVLKVLKGAQT